MSVRVHKNKKLVKDNTGHKQDFYPTPTSLIKELLKTGILNESKIILDPACGQHAIDDTLRDTGLFKKVIGTDIIYGDDFLTKRNINPIYDTIVMNPPFELFDDFVFKAKEVAPLVISIGKTDLFSAYQRYYNGLWKNLKAVYIFDRKVFEWSFYRNVKLVFAVSRRSKGETYLARIVAVFFFDFPNITNFLFSFCCRYMTMRP